ncbi:hypothetical protein [Robbsia andropogonis]|uniref:YunG family protein n=1 Tax=Robbsia andropogonis TaxID=28092 RepID=UPI000B1E9675|nr:hypothetical protein [Robbsia andropogonis]
MAATGSKADTSECERETLVRRSAIAPKALVAAPDSGRKGNKQLDRNSLTDLIAEGRLLTHASPHVFYHCDLPSLAFPFGIAAGDVHTLEIRSYMCFEALPATTGLLLFGCPIACWLTERAKSDEFCIENLCYTPRLVHERFHEYGLETRPVPIDVWSPSSPAQNHCSVTSLIVQDYFGGQILATQTSGGKHFYNLIDGRKWDLTVSQFSEPVP